ncbi:hypothetical protein AQ790_00385 [Burkholderia pseudomallei]|nr:hypothetical protein AQ790_00385 [Burkholderia pseudomallei]
MIDPAIAADTLVEWQLRKRFQIRGNVRDRIDCAFQFDTIIDQRQLQIAGLRKQRFRQFDDRPTGEGLDADDARRTAAVAVDRVAVRVQWRANANETIGRTDVKTVIRQGVWFFAR